MVTPQVLCPPITLAFVCFLPSSDQVPSGPRALASLPLPFLGRCLFILWVSAQTPLLWQPPSLTPKPHYTIHTFYFPSQHITMVYKCHRCRVSPGSAQGLTKPDARSWPAALPSGGSGEHLFPAHLGCWQDAVPWLPAPSSVLRPATLRRSSLGCLSAFNSLFPVFFLEA